MFIQLQDDTYPFLNTLEMEKQHKMESECLFEYGDKIFRCVTYYIFLMVFYCFEESKEKMVRYSFS